MFRIIDQPCKLRKMGLLNLTEKEYSEDWLKVVKLAEFGLKYGYKAAVEAFNISKSTYYNYLAIYKSTQSNMEYFKCKSRRPINVRKPNWNNKIIKFIRQMRIDRPNIGKEKIKYYLDKFCIANNLQIISTGTIRNIINSHSNKLRTKKSTIVAKRRQSVVRKPAKYKPNKSGECVALDSMEFRQSGKKLYVVVVQDEATNLLYAEATTSHTSRSTKSILDNAHNYLPWSKFTTILTDNGTEFQKDFASFLKENHITHYHTYHKTPKQNARCERVNRTIQDEFMIKYGGLLFDNIHLSNKKLLKYLHWYNFKRVHFRFSNNMTPFQYHLHITKQ